MDDVFEPSRYVLTDTVTGEAVDIHIFFEKARKSGWEKSYARLLAEYIGCGGSSTTKVLAYLIRERDEKNRIFGSQVEIAKAAGVSTPTVKTVFRSLNEKKLIKMVRCGLYMLTPEMIRNGDNCKGAMLLRIWGEI